MKTHLKAKAGSGQSSIRAAGCEWRETDPSGRVSASMAEVSDRSQRKTDQ
jgi:hypothetical protein